MQCHLSLRFAIVLVSQFYSLFFLFLPFDLILYTLLPVWVLMCVLVCKCMTEFIIWQPLAAPQTHSSLCTTTNFLTQQVDVSIKFTIVEVSLHLLPNTHASLHIVYTWMCVCVWLSVFKMWEFKIFPLKPLFSLFL